MSKRIEDRREPEDPIWVCECGHIEERHEEDEEGKFPCAVRDCLCDDFSVEEEPTE